MKKISLILIISTISLVLYSCAKKETKTDLLSGKTFETVNQWGEQESYNFKADGTATYKVITNNGIQDLELVTIYNYELDEENEVLNLSIIKYPYLENDEKYISLTFSELVEKDPEGEADYKKIFEKTVSYKYLLMPDKLKMDMETFELKK